MPISDVASLIGGAVLGAPVSEIFKLVIEGAKKVKDFKPISEDLASTMERLVPIFKDIESMQQGSNTGMGELKFLIKTMQRADEMVRKCSGVEWYCFPSQALYASEIENINQDFLKFCRVELPLILRRDQLRSMRSFESVSTKIDLLTLTDTAKGSAELFVVPQPETVTIFWLARAFTELKKMLLKDKVVTIVVSAPSPCGKTMLVTKLCHDADVKGKFKHILFITVSKAPNLRLIIQRFLQQTGREAKEFADGLLFDQRSADNLDANRCIQQLLKQLGESGPILLVLDDVWPADESFLDKFLIQLLDYKILVTSRLEFLRFGPTYYLEPLIDEEFKNLFVARTLESNCTNCAKRDDLLLKIGERCNWPFPAMNPPCSNSMCGGCNSEIEHGRSVDVLGVLWHRECFCCDACHKPIAIHKVENHVLNSRGKFHKACYQGYCYVCKATKMKKYNQHIFWKERYCRAHESDGTPKCCSCERLEPKGTNYVKLGDDRRLCLQCMESSVMDTYECHNLHLEIRELFEGLFIKVEKEFPLLLVEKQALNKAEEEEKIDYHHAEVTRGSICLSQPQPVTNVSEKPKMGPNNTLVDMVTETLMVTGCEVTAILIIYGLPRLLTGYMLAHEMMHAYLRLNGHRNMNKVLEEGICQVLGHLWLECQTYATTDGSKKGECASDFEKQLVKFCKNKIETDDSLYGVAFRKVNHMVTNSSLRETIKQIIRWG